MRYFVVKKLNRWENTKLEQSPNDMMRLPFPVDMKAGDDGCIGFLPVYDNIEKALAYADNDMNQITIIETKGAAT